MRSWYYMSHRNYQRPLHTQRDPLLIKVQTFLINWSTSLVTTYLILAGAPSHHPSGACAIQPIQWSQDQVLIQVLSNICSFYNIILPSIFIHQVQWLTLISRCIKQYIYHNDLLTNVNYPTFNRSITLHRYFDIVWLWWKGGSPIYMY